MRKCSAIRKLRSIIFRKNPYNSLYFDLVWPKNGSIEQNFYPMGDRSMLFICGNCFAVHSLKS